MNLLLQICGICCLVLCSADGKPESGFARALTRPKTGVGASEGPYEYRPLGKISVKDPAFVRVLQCSNSPPSLWITHFSALTAGEVLRVFNLSASYPNFSAANVQLLSSDFKWPNIISIAPAEIGEYLVVPDGFLVPLKETGGLYLLKINCNSSEISQPLLTAATPIEITAPKTSFFYHMVVWQDMNNDGLLDVVTARANDPLFGTPSGQLLWLEQPKTDPLTNVPWTEHPLVDGPETVFIFTDLDPEDDQYEVIAPQFFTQHLALYAFGLKNNSLLYSRYLDETIGPAYDAELVDLNNDGARDLLITNHVGDSGGSVYGYEIPSDFRKGDFKRHTLATGFAVTEKGSHQYAPGFAYSFKPHTSYDGKPYILVAGDGSQKAYLLTPTVADFTYNNTVIVSFDGVVGSIGFGDIIGKDGWTEFFVPDYDGNAIYGYTFAPQ